MLYFRLKMLNLDCPDDLSRYGGPWAIILITADC